MENFEIILVSVLLDLARLLRFPLGVMASISGLAAGFIVIRLQDSSLGIIDIITIYWVQILIGLPIPALIVCGAMAINDAMDYESDKANNRLDRPLVRGVFSPLFALSLALIMLAIGGLLSIVLVNLGLHYVNYWVVVFTFGFIAIAVSYSTWLKKYGFWGNVSVSLSYPAAILLGGFVVGFQRADVLIAVASFGTLIFFTALGRELLKGVMDLEGDKLVGVMTIAARYGPKTAAIGSLLCFLTSASIAPIPAYFAFRDHSLSLLLYAAFVILMIGLNIYAGLALVREPSHEVSTKGRKRTKLALWSGTLGYFLSAIAL